MTSNKISQYKTVISSNFIVFCELSLLMIPKVFWKILVSFALVQN
jgi:hypothetical protein